MQATVSDDGLSFMFTVTERKDIARALDEHAAMLIRESRLRANSGDSNREGRAFLRREAVKFRLMARQFRAGEGYGL